MDFNNIHEAQLKEVEDTFIKFSKKYRLRLFLHYKDLPSYTLFWWKRRVVRFIQLAPLNYNVNDRYGLWIGAYKLFLPILNFWTVYLGIPNDFSKKICEIKYPFNIEDVEKCLEKAREEIGLVDAKVITNRNTSSFVMTNLFLPENMWTIILFFFILMIFVYIARLFL